METKSIVLQKGDYDENGAAAYNKDKSGDNFKRNNVVKKLQNDLITTNFLPKGSDDGFFGDQTDKAVKDFQDYAIKLVRMKRSLGKTENTDKGLDQQSPDGIVGEKTRDELDKWLNKDWIKPIPTLRHGEYDNTGVDNGKGKRGTDDHHQGTPVVEAQNNLQKVGVYSDGMVDGWFYDKMLCSVKDFQSAAADATFVVNGNLTQFDQKLTGYQKGEMCPATQEYLKMVVDKSGKVPPKPAIFPLKNRPDLSYHDGAREFGAARKHGRKHAGCDLNAPIGTEIFAVKDGKITHNPYEFAGETFALEIDHGDCIVRYGEIQKELPPGLGVGKMVKQGQLIAYVGKFVTENNEIKHMLHFEMYSGEESGPLSDKLNPPYQRRGDLMDPTSFLDNAILLTP
jgi:peptidoglycan hydrolase-like protein with peptidoglycan-binding domain